ncbi:8031_t:CDS:2, partial [Entrophospora sp. SA101]
MSSSRRRGRSSSLEDFRSSSSKRRNRSPSPEEHDSKHHKKHKHKKKSKEHKEHKERKEHKEDKLSLIQLSAYSNVDNPFGDVNLGEKFEWKKKKDRDKKMGLTPEEIMQRERERQEEAQLELEKLNKRRAEREREQQLREEELARIQRESEAGAMGDLASKEDEFHLEQAKVRAEIRIKENRAKPIDILAINLRLSDESDQVDESLEIDIDEPYTILENLNLEEVKELHGDILKYLSLEKNPNHLEFWR